MGDCKVRGCWQEMRNSQHVPDSLELELEQMMDDTGLCKSDFELILLWFQTKLRWESISLWQCQWFHGFCVVHCRIPGIIRSWIFSFFHPLIWKHLQPASCSPSHACFCSKEMSVPPTQKGEEGVDFSFHRSMTCGEMICFSKSWFSGMSEQNEPQARICSEFLSFFCFYLQL